MKVVLYESVKSNEQFYVDLTKKKLLNTFTCENSSTQQYNDIFLNDRLFIYTSKTI